MGEPLEGSRVEGDSRELGCILALSDGVFAIALTLLVDNTGKRTPFSTRRPGNPRNLTHFFHFLFYGCRRRSFEY
jgi:hypothetical protein